MTWTHGGREERSAYRGPPLRKQSVWVGALGFVMMIAIIIVIVGGVLATVFQAGACIYRAL